MTPFSHSAIYCSSVTHLSLSLTQGLMLSCFKNLLNNFQKDISIFFSRSELNPLDIQRDIFFAYFGSILSFSFLVYYSAIELLVWLCVKITACHTKPMLLLFSVVLTIICHHHSHCLLEVKISQIVRFLSGMMT